MAFLGFGFFLLCSVVSREKDRKKQNEIKTRNERRKENVLIPLFAVNIRRKRRSQCFPLRKECFFFLVWKTFCEKSKWWIFQHLVVLSRAFINLPQNLAMMLRLEPFQQPAAWLRTFMAIATMQIPIISIKILPQVRTISVFSIIWMSADISRTNFTFAACTHDAFVNLVRLGCVWSDDVLCDGGLSIFIFHLNTSSNESFSNGIRHFHSNSFRIDDFPKKFELNFSLNFHWVFTKNLSIFPRMHRIPSFEVVVRSHWHRQAHSNAHFRDPILTE